MPNEPKARASIAAVNLDFPIMIFYFELFFLRDSTARMA